MRFIKNWIIRELRVGFGRRATVRELACVGSGRRCCGDSPARSEQGELFNENEYILSLPF